MLWCCASYHELLLNIYEALSTVILVWKYDKHVMYFSKNR